MDLPITLLAFSASLSALCVQSIGLEFGKSLIDVPNERSSHTRVTPRSGGLAFSVALILIALLAAWGAIPGVEKALQLAFVAGALPFGVIGLVDDLFTLSPRKKLAGHFLSGASLVLALDAAPAFLSFSGLQTTFLLILAVIAVVAVVNFYNFMDGIDGIIAGCAVVQFSFWAIFLGQDWCWAVTGVLLGFLFFNWSPAKIFMGDCGSNLIGALVAVALLSSASFPTLVLASAVTLPVTADALYTLFCRARRKENLFRAHKSHIYQRLHQANVSHGSISGFYVLLNILVATFIYSFSFVGMVISILAVIASGAAAERFISKDSLCRSSEAGKPAEAGNAA